MGKNAEKPLLVARLTFPLVGILVALVVNAKVPDLQDRVETNYYPLILLLLLILYSLLLVFAFWWKRVKERLVYWSPIIGVGILLVVVWELVTAKFFLLPLPYFPGPERVVLIFFKDWDFVGISILYSLRLLALGYLFGVISGLVTGVLMGWNKKANYWLMPVMKVVGPVPATAWIPVVMVAFPTSFAGSIFLIALAVWFPVTVMTSSGINNVQNSYFEVAKTLGANQRFLIFKIAIPAAFPMIFIGLFMGLGMSFSTLIVAEMLGVKAGLGWYITWAQSWAEYTKVYASLILIAVVFSGIMTMLFRARDRILVWQKGLIKW